MGPSPWVIIYETESGLSIDNFRPFDYMKKLIVTSELKGHLDKERSGENPCGVKYPQIL